LFADDAKVYANIVEVHDVVELQNALDALAHWAHTWQILISKASCTLMAVCSWLLQSVVI